VNECIRSIDLAWCGVMTDPSWDPDQKCLLLYSTLLSRPQVLIVKCTLGSRMKQYSTLYEKMLRSCSMKVSSRGDSLVGGTYKIHAKDLLRLVTQSSISTPSTLVLARAIPQQSTTQRAQKALRFGCSDSKTHLPWEQ
jgi:hypothetical protein